MNVEPQAVAIDSPTRHPIRGACAAAGKAIVVIAALFLAAMLLALVIVPRLMGWVPLTVLSGSMEPNIPIGSQVMVDRVESADDMAAINPGEVITFMPEPDDPTLVTHRVVSQGVRADGSVSLRTQGDANDAVDPGSVTLQQIRGVTRYHIPYAGYVASVLDGQQKRSGTIIVAVLLFGYAGFNLIAALRDRRKTDSDSDSDDNLLDEITDPDPSIAATQPSADEFEPEPRAR